MFETAPVISAIVEKRKALSPERALLVGTSGIDASGKGFLTARIAKQLEAPRDSVTGVGDPGYNVAVIGVDGWLNLPQIRFNPENPAEHFYEHALRFDEMFEQLIVPLQRHRSISLDAEFTEETATSYKTHRYEFHNIDVILLEGIFLLKPAYRHHFDLTVWIDCSFATALKRAIRRCQEGLPPAETIRAHEEIYFAAQRIHFARDNPRLNSDIVLANDVDFSGSVSR